MKKRNIILLAVSGVVVLGAVQPLCFAATTYNPEPARHLAAALTTAGSMTESDDYNSDGKVNAIDLTLMKRALLDAQADTGELTQQTVPVSENVCKLIGRTLAKDDVTWLVQSGSAVECTVTATEASVVLAGDGCVYSDEKWRPRYAVFVDDELVADVLMDEPEQTVELFSGSAQRTAKVKVIHLSEANNGAIGVKSFTVTSSAASPVKPTAKKDLTIEFIGDSITCAYGVEADSQYVNFETGTENFMKSYAYLTAELLDADYSAVSYSGHGIISGYSNDGEIQTDSLVPDVYTFVGKPGNYAVEWDFDAHPSDVVVLNLGTNDDSYASKDLETRGAEYQAGYEAFLKEIRKYNPDATIVCTLGIMGCEELYPYIEAAVAAVGDPNTVCYQSPTQNAANGYGADWHPSPATHELNAYLLADKICSAIGREWSRIGIDMAAEGEYHVEVNAEQGANAATYFSDWDHSMWINVVNGGSSSESISFHVSGFAMPAGTYELSFSAQPPQGMEVQYVVRSMNDTSKIYCSGTMNTSGEQETVLESFEMAEPDDACEIVCYVGGFDSVSITFRDVTLFKRS